MDLVAFFKEYPALVTVAAGLLGIILGAVLTRWNDSRKKVGLQNRELERRAAERDLQIKEAKDLVDAFDFIIHGLISHVEELVTVIQDGDADHITEQFHKMNEFRLKMKSLLAESKSKLADIALLNDRKLLEMFLTLADSARTVRDEIQAIPAEYAYGDSAFADARLKKLQDVFAETVLAEKSIKDRIDELALQIE